MKNDKYPHFLECHNDHVVLMADDLFTGEPEEHTVTIDDVNSYGTGMSGLSSLGSITGDHRMITAIYEDVYDYFLNEYPEKLVRESHE